ncbi:MAG: hypothetical protein ACMUJM_15050 [bacterium]
MKKALIGIMVVTLIGIFGATHALAANEGTISVTVTIASVLEISVSPASWAPSVGSNSTVDTLLDSPGPSVTNNSNTSIDLTVNVDDTGSSWTFADNPSGSDTFAMDIDTDGGSSWNEITVAGYTFLSSVAAYSPPVEFDLLFYSPPTAIAGASATFNVTITATETP